MKSLKTLFILLPLALTSCSRDLQEELKKQSSSLMSQFQQLHLSEAEKMATLHVTDLEGKAIPNAQILIGQALGEPFSSNFVTADANGVFAAPSEWTSPQTVTLSAPGYLRASYVGQMPSGQSFQLRPADKPKQYEVKGKATGFKVVDNDDKADFALIIPLLQKSDLFAFDASKVVSRQKDMIEVYGQKIYLPSNVSMPKQKERYGLFPVTLDKPAYRMYFENLGTEWVYAARGQFPFNKVVGEMQKKEEFFGLINHFTIHGGGLKAVTISGATQDADLPVDELVFNLPRTVLAPSFATQQNLLVVSVSPFRNGFFPTDLKNMPSKGNMKLMTAAGAEPQLLALLQNKPDADGKLDGKMSVSFTGFAANMTPNLLPLMDSVEIVNPNLLKVKPISMPNFLNSGGTYSLLSRFEKRSQDGITFDALVRVWEVYGADWTTDIEIPTWPNDAAIAGKKRWQVSFVGSPDKGIDLGPMMLENATHATHAQADF